jgi:hypothetical protein
MKMPDHFSALTLDSQSERYPLKPLRDLQLKKLVRAGYWGLLALAGSFIWSLVLFQNRTTVPIFSATGFPEWRMETGIRAQTVVISEILFALEQLVDAIGAFFLAINDGQIAATSRTLACIFVLIAVLFTFRRLLAEHYNATGQRLQYEEQIRMQKKTGIHKWLRPVAVAVCSMVSVYVLTSLAWMALGVIFKQFSASPLASAIFSAAFVAVTTFVAVYFVLTLTKLQLAALAMLTFLLGLGGTFAMAGVENGEQWWQASISRAGAYPDSNWLFIATLLSICVIFLVLWFDIDQFMRLIVAEADRSSPITASMSVLQRQFRSHAYAIIRLLYALAVAGLLGVAFVRVHPDDGWTTAAHTGGALLAIAIFTLGGLVFAFWFPNKILGQPFRLFSVGCAAVYLISLVLFLTSILNLAGVELIVLMVIGLWFYFALDTILTYVDALL